MGTAAHIPAGIDAGYSGASNLTYDYTRHGFAAAGLDWGNVVESLSIGTPAAADTTAVTRTTASTTDADTASDTVTDAATETTNPTATPTPSNPLLATLLSDQCPYATKAIVFDGDGKQRIRERHTFTGSLLSQLDEAGMLLNRINESGRYPAAALREALVNALEHRDYTYSGPTLINVFDSRLEIISLGGLTDGFAINDLLNGICQPRNPMLAQLLADLGLCEDCGTGVQRIMDAYAGNPVSPQLRVGPSSVALVLPTLVEAANSPNPRDRGSASSDTAAAAASSDRTDGIGHNNIYHFPTFQRVTDQAAEALAGPASSAARHCRRWFSAWGSIGSHASWPTTMAALQPPSRPKSRQPFRPQSHPPARPTASPAPAPSPGGAPLP